MGQNLRKTTRGSGFPGVNYRMKLLLYLGLKGQGREWFLEDGKWSTMERIMKRWHQPTAIGKGNAGERKRTSTLLSFSSPQCLLLVKPNWKSKRKRAHSCSPWIGLSEDRANLEGIESDKWNRHLTMRNQGWVQGLWPEHLEGQSCHLLRWKRI